MAPRRMSRAARTRPDEGRPGHAPPSQEPPFSPVEGAIMVSDPVRRLAERPTIQARHYLASTGHYLATAAATRILDAGGNATDAGVAAGICINVLMPDLTSFGGVAPIVVYDKAREEVKTISGLGTWGRDVTLEGYLERFKGEI